jgi:hypothetical protein
MTLAARLLPLTLLFTTPALAREAGVDIGFNCAGSNCHGQDSPQGTTTVTVDGLPSIVRMGVTYDLAVLVSNPNYERHGFAFQVTRGNIQVTDTDRTQLYGGSPRDITHTLDRSDCGSAGCASRFAFKWTAPDTAGSVTFRWRGNAVNGNRMSTGDTPSAAVESTTRTVAAPEDMAQPPDLKAPPDLALPPDLAVVPDLAPPPDLGNPADLCPPADLGAPDAGVMADLGQQPAGDLGMAVTDAGVASDHDHDHEPQPPMAAGCGFVERRRDSSAWLVIAVALLIGLTVASRRWR